MSVRCRIACHSPALAAASRGAGLHMNLAPSKPGRSMSAAVRVKYCGQVSAHTFTPRACARATSSAASIQET